MQDHGRDGASRRGMNRPAPWPLTAGLIERRPFRVGGAMVDPVSRDANWSGGGERLQPQTLKVLITLFSRRGDVVTRDELVQLCWDGRIVGDDVINRSISLVRHVAEKAGGFEIQTVPRTGYRLVEGESSSLTPRRRWIAAAAVILVCIAGVSTWALFGRQPPSQGVPPTPSISIMPFVAEGNDPLARQVAQAAPVSISRMMADSGFAVIRDDPGGKPPSTDYVFSGDVQHQANLLEATVQLISKRDGSVLYTHNFSEPLAQSADLPDRIGAAIAAELAWTGAQMALDPREHLTPEITSELMNSIIQTVEGHDRLRSYQLSRHAAAAAPNSAFAQLSFAATTGFGIGIIPRGEREEALALGRSAAERARALAPEFGDVYLTWCQLHSPLLLTECDARVRHAFKIDSSSSFVPGYLSNLLYGAGRIDESLQLASQSLANDPYKPAKLARMIRMLEVSGQSDQAEQVYREAMRLWPDNMGRMRASRLLGLAERGNYAGLAAFADPATDGPLIDPPAFAPLMAAQKRNDLAGARRACATKGLTDFTLSLCMTILADLGDFDGSYAIAATLYPAWKATNADGDEFWLDHVDGFATELLNAPAAKAMRTDPRFFEIAQKEGLLAYWLKDGLPDYCRGPEPEPVCARIGKRK
jgi:DNA-binding winged helix-turn-helix (wHTH) protein/tetratricopeptide (TPR) repeat protein